MVPRMEMVVVERKVRGSSGVDGVVDGDGDIKDDNDGVISGVATGIVAGTIVRGVAIEEELSP